jgi:hypothetical protein
MSTLHFYIALATTLAISNTRNEICTTQTTRLWLCLSLFIPLNAPTLLPQEKYGNDREPTLMGHT